MAHKQKDIKITNTDIILRETEYSIITAYLVKLTDVIVINDHICVVTSFSHSKAHKSITLLKHHLMGFDIFTKQKYEILCYGSDTFIKLNPHKCNMRLDIINNDNTCNLWSNNNIVENVEMPLKHIKNIINDYNEGLKITVSADNYLDTLCHIKDYWV